MNKELIAFYNEYVSTGSNITAHAKKNGITNTMCYQLIKMHEQLSKI